MVLNVQSFVFYKYMNSYTFNLLILGTSLSCKCKVEGEIVAFRFTRCMTYQIKNENRSTYWLSIQNAKWYYIGLFLCIVLGFNKRKKQRRIYIILIFIPSSSCWWSNSAQKLNGNSYCKMDENSIAEFLLELNSMFKTVEFNTM